ncbi:hypothetical protein AS850_00905 [Frondihabitans sp. 762G35]|uniref:hypothetical protein n=1 Tax=Frondihabitans sp. 762G35 TaxID=1446794 RepID=UPI000D212A2D|nr:hypothetical protein [Frondihabitans sp. 762G35]ARC55632.1 hypothetical protein AS850_00905 [Frondihabitans sp. 762G35]
MGYSPQVAALIQERLDIMKVLDDRVELSFLERARFRMELLSVLDCYNSGRLDAASAHGSLVALRVRILETVDQSSYAS